MSAFASTYEVTSLVHQSSSREYRRKVSHNAVQLLSGWIMPTTGVCNAVDLYARGKGNAAGDAPSTILRHWDGRNKNSAICYPITEENYNLPGKWEGKRGCLRRDLTSFAVDILGERKGPWELWYGYSEWEREEFKEAVRYLLDNTTRKVRRKLLSVYRAVLRDALDHAYGGKKMLSMHGVCFQTSSRVLHPGVNCYALNEHLGMRWPGSSYPGSKYSYFIPFGYGEKLPDPYGEGSRSPDWRWRNTQGAFRRDYLRFVITALRIAGV